MFHKIGHVIFWGITPQDMWNLTPSITAQHATSILFFHHDYSKDNSFFSHDF